MSIEIVKIATIDGIIWNEIYICNCIIGAMIRQQDITLDLLSEGPDLSTLTLYQFLSDSAELLDYDLTRIKIITSNPFEQHHSINIEYTPPMHLLTIAKDYQVAGEKSAKLKHFGMFIGRSNAPRLDLASYIDSRYAEQSIYTYHFDPTDEFHLSNIGLEDLITQYAVADLTVPAAFLARCPVLLNRATVVDKSSKLNPAQQLLKTDSGTFEQQYQNFFVEIVCESYFTGNTFFVTEKTWRPMLLKTPFIVQGPQHFLNNLQRLGFKTFKQWWNEGYSEDPVNYQLIEIKLVIDRLAKKTPTELVQMYKDMQEILDHNYQLALTLGPNDFNKLV